MAKEVFYYPEGKQGLLRSIIWAGLNSLGNTVKAEDYEAIRLEIVGMRCLRCNFQVRENDTRFFDCAGCGKPIERQHLHKQERKRK